MSWGKWGKQFTTQQATEMIQFCADNGYSIFDHADIYGGYTTEAEFGKAFTRAGIQRKNVKYITKCGIQLKDENRNSTLKHYDYSKEHIVFSAEQSLKNLQTDYLDTFLLHRPSPIMQAEEIAEAIFLLQKSGKIINFGVSNFTPSQIDLIAKYIPVKVNQIEFSLTHNKAMQNGSLDHMIQKDIQAMCWSPLGTVFKKENKSLQKALEHLTEKYHVTSDVLLLAWILKHPANISPVIGTTNKARIKNAKKLLSLIYNYKIGFYY